MPKLDVTKTRTYVFLAAFATILPVITYFNIPIPKVAWAEDLENLEENQLEFSVEYYDDIILEREQKILEIQRHRTIEERQEEPNLDPYFKEEEYVKKQLQDTKRKRDQNFSRLLELKK